MATTWDNEGYIELTKGNKNSSLDGRVYWQSRTLSESSRKSEVAFQVQLKLSDKAVNSGVVLSSMNLDFNLAGIGFGDYEVKTQLSDDFAIYNYDKVLYSWSGNGSYSIKPEWQDFFGGFVIEVEHRADGWASAAIRVGIFETGDVYDNSRYNLTHNYYGVEIPYLIPLESMPLRATISSATNFNFGTNPTIYYNNPGKGEVKSLQAGIFNKSGSKAYAAYRDISVYENSYTFELTDAERAKLEADANEKDLPIRFYLKTHYNYPVDYHDDTPTTSTYYAASTKTYTPMDKSPVISFISAVDRNPTTIALTGNPNTLVRYHSNAFVSAQIDTYNNIDYTITIHDYMTYPIPTVNGEIIGIVEPGFSLVVKDAEGRWSVKGYHTPEEFWVEYFKPTCVLQEATIELVEETEAKIAIKVSGEVFRGKFGGDALAKSNTIMLQARYKADNGDWSDWAGEQAFLPEFTGNEYEASVNMSGLPYNKTYTIQCRAVDSLNSAETVEYTLKLTPVFDWGENDFNFNVPVSFQGSPMVDFIIEQGTEAMGSNGTWYWSKWKNGRAECYGIRNYGNMGINVAFGNLYASADFNQSLPYGLFAAAPEYISIVPMSGGFGTWVNKGGGDAPTATTTGTFELVRPNTKNLSQANIGFHVIGRWK